MSAVRNFWHDTRYSVCFYSFCHSEKRFSYYSGIDREQSKKCVKKNLTEIFVFLCGYKIFHQGKKLRGWMSIHTRYEHVKQYFEISILSSQSVNANDFELCDSLISYRINKVWLFQITWSNNIYNYLWLCCFSVWNMGL